VPGKLTDVDDQRNWIVPRKFSCPTDDKFFRVIVEVPLVERRRIHRIEKLLDSIDINFDSMKRSLG
jgi:hypothetical protein